MKEQFISINRKTYTLEELSAIVKEHEEGLEAPYSRAISILDNAWNHYFELVEEGKVDEADKFMVKTIACLAAETKVLESVVVIEQALTEE